MKGSDHLGSPAVWRRETVFLCHHPGQEGRHPEVLAFPGPVHLPSSGPESEERMLRANLHHFYMKNATAGLVCEGDETASAVGLIFSCWWVPPSFSFLVALSSSCHFSC